MNVTKCSSIMPARYVSFGKRKEQKELTPEEKLLQEDYRLLWREAAPIIWGSAACLAIIAGAFRQAGLIPTRPCMRDDIFVTIKTEDDSKNNIDYLDEELLPEIDNNSDEETPYETDEIMEISED